MQEGQEQSKVMIIKMTENAKVSLDAGSDFETHQAKKSNLQLE